MQSTRHTYPNIVHSLRIGVKEKVKEYETTKLKIKTLNAAREIY